MKYFQRNNKTILMTSASRQFLMLFNSMPLKDRVRDPMAVLRPQLEALQDRMKDLGGTRAAD